MAIISGGKITEGTATSRIVPNAGAPVDGTTGAGSLGKGTLLVDTTNANMYINAGTLAAPVWKIITRAA